MIKKKETKFKWKMNVNNIHEIWIYLKNKFKDEYLADEIISFSLNLEIDYALSKGALE